MMKKIIALIIALAMALSMSTSTYATNVVADEALPVPTSAVVSASFEVATTNGVELVLDEGTVVTLKDSDMADELGGAVVVLPETSRNGEVLEETAIKDGCGFGAETVWIAHKGDRIYTHGHKWSKLHAVTVCPHGKKQTACDGWIAMRDVRLED